MSKVWMVGAKVRELKVRSSSNDIDSFQGSRHNFVGCLFCCDGCATCCFIFEQCRIVWRTRGSSESATFCSNKLKTLFHITNFHRVALLHFTLDTVTPRRGDGERIGEEDCDKERTGSTHGTKVIFFAFCYIRQLKSRSIDRITAEAVHWVKISRNGT